MFNFGKKEKIAQEQEKRTEYELNVQKRAEILNQSFYPAPRAGHWGKDLFYEISKNKGLKELSDKYHSEVDITPEEIFKNDAAVEDFARDLLQKGEMSEKDFNLLTKGSLIMFNTKLASYMDHGRMDQSRDIEGNLAGQKIELKNFWSGRTFSSEDFPIILDKSNFEGIINGAELTREEAKDLYEKCFNLIKLRDEKLWNLKKEREEKADLIFKNNFKEDVEKLTEEKLNKEKNKREEEWKKEKEKLKKDEEERKRKVDDALDNIL